MNRDNLVFASCGFLLGLILGGVMIGPKIVEWRGAKGRVPAAPVASAAGSAAPGPAAAGPGGEATMAMIRARLDQLKKRVAANPDDAPALVELGNLYMDAAKFEQASGYYARSLATRSDPAVEMDLAICYRETRQFDKALSIFRKVYAESPDRWQARFNEAIVLAEMGNLAEARGLVAQLRRARPGDPDVLRFEQSLAAAP